MTYNMLSFASPPVVEVSANASSFCNLSQSALTEEL